MSTRQGQLATLAECFTVILPRVKPLLVHPKPCSIIHIISGKPIVSRYVAESTTTDAGCFGHVGLCQLHTISSLDIGNVAMSLYYIIQIIHAVKHTKPWMEGREYMHILPTTQIQESCDRCTLTTSTCNGVCTCNDI